MPAQPTDSWERFNEHRGAGADQGFPRGGGGGIFKKKIENFVHLFFRSTKLIFRALPRHYKDPERPCFGQNICATGKILKKQGEKAVFGARSPLPLLWCFQHLVHVLLRKEASFGLNGSSVSDDSIVPDWEACKRSTWDRV